jgi:hypothetical protein
LPRDVEDRQEVFRQLFEHLGEKWTGCLFLHSSVIRNLELVSDAEKRTHLAEAMQGWAYFTFHALLLISQLVRHRKIGVNKVEYNVMYADKPLTKREDEELRRLIASGVAGLLPGSPAERGKRASREMRKLERAKLVRQLRLQARQKV